MAWGERFEGRDHFYARDDGGRFRLRAFAFFDQLAERLRDRVLRLGGRTGLRVVEQRAGAALGEDLGDAAAHGAGAGDTGDEIGSGSVQHERENRYFSRAVAIIVLRGGEA